MGIFGKNLRLYRRSKDMTLRELGGLTGTLASYLSELENGKKGVTLEKARKLADALDCTVDDLLSPVSPLEKAINTIPSKRKAKQEEKV